jgi:anti-sigma factor RsiW
VLHPESLRVQAYSDGELDAVSAVAVERHIAECENCRAWLQDLERLRASLRRDLTDWRAPAALRNQMMRQLNRQVMKTDSRSFRGVWRLRSLPQFWLGILSGGALSAIIAVLVFAMWVPSLNNSMIGELTNAHMHSLIPTHLVDVVSTDRHTVKPWFAGQADVSPTVADFEDQGYRLIGGRADYLDHQRAAVVVYQHGAHIINVFSWGGTQHSLPASATRNGYHLLFWKADDLKYCAISDLDPKELLELSRLLQAIPASNPRQ